MWELTRYLLQMIHIVVMLILDVCQIIWLYPALNLERMLKSGKPITLINSIGYISKNDLPQKSKDSTSSGRDGL